MECNIKPLVAYHGTDECFVLDIIEKGFKINKNPEHWLGNGIYFYLDYKLAKWWTTRPTKKFGNNIKNPVVIRALIHSTPDNTLDTRNFSDYHKLLELYGEFMQELLKGGTVIGEIPEEALRCSFFDWVHSNYPYDIFIAGFEKKKRSHDYGTDFHYKFKIPYIEYQLCVFSNDLIIQKERMSEYEEA